MEFGRFRFAHSRSLLVFLLVLLCGYEFKAWAQHDPALPVSQAGVGNAGTNADTSKDDGDINPATGERGGPKREPVQRWIEEEGDWSFKGRVSDF